jgi:RNA polymerase sigma factor (sigma-70 family)
MAAALSNVVRVPMGDSADVELAAGGDRLAFERLYRTHASRVYSLCARMSGSRTRGEELTQDVFVRTWEKLPQFRGESAFSTWLHRLAVNVVLNARKTEGKQASRTEEGDVDDERWDEMARAPLHIERMDLTDAERKMAEETTLATVVERSGVYVIDVVFRLAVLVDYQLNKQGFSGFNFQARKHWIGQQRLNLAA